MNKVLTKVVEAVAKELARLYECFDTYEGNANIQVNILSFLHNAVFSPLTNPTRSK